jgi:hypothetical protein
LTFLERRNEGKDRFLVDLIVVVWCAKTWCAETWGSRRDRPGTKEGEFEWPGDLLSTWRLLLNLGSLAEGIDGDWVERGSITCGPGV